jgi:hypothetical protein
MCWRFPYIEQILKVKPFHLLKVLMYLNHYISKFTFLPNYCILTYRKFQSFRLIENVHISTKFQSSYQLPIKNNLPIRNLEYLPKFHCFSYVPTFSNLCFFEQWHKFSYFRKYSEYLKIFLGLQIFEKVYSLLNISLTATCSILIGWKHFWKFGNFPKGYISDYYCNQFIYAVEVTGI